MIIYIPYVDLHFKGLSNFKLSFFYLDWTDWFWMLLVRRVSWVRMSSCLDGETCWNIWLILFISVVIALSIVWFNEINILLLACLFWLKIPWFVSNVFVFISWVGSSNSSVLQGNSNLYGVSSLCYFSLYSDIYLLKLFFYFSE